MVKYWGGPASYLRKHRGPTHGLPVLLVLALAVALALTWVWPTANVWQVYVWTLVGSLSHVLFDFGNDYGTQGLWPLSKRRIAFDLVPIIDVRLLALILLGWTIHSLWPGHRQTVFTLVWVAIGLYVLYRAWQRRQASRLVADHYDVSEPCTDAVPCGEGWQEERISIHPTLFSLDAWRYVVQMPGEYMIGMVWVGARRVGSPTRARNDMDRVVMASLKAQLVTEFSRWVRRPRVEIHQEKGLYRVRWSDMRWESDGFSPFTAYAWLDEELNLVDEGLGPKRPDSFGTEQVKRALLRELGRLE